MAAYTRERGGVLMTPTPNGVRAPKAATVPTKITYSKIGMGRNGQYADWDADTAIDRAFYLSVFVYRAVQLRAQLLSNLPIRVGADPDKPNDYDQRAPLLGFLKGNREVAWRTLMAFSSAQYDVTGRYAWELDRDGIGVPIAPYPLLAQHLFPVPTDSGPAYFKGFEYVTQSGFASRVKTLTTNQCHYAWRPHHTDFRQPESPLQAASLNIAALTMLDAYTAAFLRNDARPAAVVVHEAFASNEETLNFRNQWYAKHQGPNNAGKPVFVEFEPDEEADGTQSVGGKLDVKSLGLSQRDMQAIQTHREEIRAVLIAYGVPISALGDASERTYDNAGVEGRNLWELTMLPYKNEHEDHINTKLAPIFSSSNVMWFDTSRVKALKDRKFSGILTPDVLFKSVTVNEVRDDLDLPSMDDGDVLLGLSAVPIAPETVVEDVDEPRPLTIDAERADLEYKATRERVRTEERIPSSPPTGAKHSSTPLLNHGERHQGEHGSHKKLAFDYEAARQRAVVRHRREVASATKSWTRALATLLDKQQAHVLSRMEGKRGRQRLEKREDGDEAALDLSGFYEPSFWAAESKEVASRLVEHTATIGGNRLTDDFDVEFDIEQERHAALVNDVATRVGEQIVTYISGGLADTMADGLAGSETVEQLRERVTQHFSDAKGELLADVAGLELSGVLNGAARVTAPPTAMPEWVMGHDEHIDYDQATEPFEFDGIRVEYPGCGCTLVFWTEEQAATRGKRIVELRTALAVLDMVEAKLISPVQVRRTLRALEAA